MQDSVKSQVLYFFLHLMVFWVRSEKSFHVSMRFQPQRSKMKTRKTLGKEISERQTMVVNLKLIKP